MTDVQTSWTVSCLSCTVAGDAVAATAGLWGPHRFSRLTGHEP